MPHASPRHLTFHWFLPTTGDSRHLAPTTREGIAAGHRPATVAYLSAIAHAAESFGFAGALTPIGQWCTDPWVVATAVAQRSERLAFLMAIRPSLLSPTLAAQMAAGFESVAPGRLLWNIVVGGEAHEQRAYGDHATKDERYAHADEFLTVTGALLRGESVDFHGRHVRVDDAELANPPGGRVPVYISGSSPAAAAVTAAHADVYLTWGEPPDEVRRKLEWVRRLAAERGRTVRFGIRFHVISRDTSDDAWREAARLTDELGEQAVVAAQHTMSFSESESQARIQRLNAAARASGDWRDPRRLEVHPNLWAGVSLARGGAGTALVGSHAEVAERIAEYAALGIEEFVLSGYPHLEELYWFGEGVLPQLRARGLAPPVEAASAAAAPFLGRIPATERAKVAVS